MSTPLHTEVAIVGAGIVGLALAYHHHLSGKKVTIFDRSDRPLGASIRNFGMIWPIGQGSATLARALRSRHTWELLSGQAGFWSEAKGSLHLAYRADEHQVLEEFMETAPDKGYRVRMMTPREVLKVSAAGKSQGLIGGMMSETEMIVDPREAIAAIARFLQASCGIEIHYQTAVTEVEEGQLRAGGKYWRFDLLEVASGADFETLFPDLYAQAGLTKVKLQMMRTKAQGNEWRMGPALCSGLTLTHYQSFAHCKSLPALRSRIAQEMPWMPAWGIHVMMSQNGQGELVIGDSHEYGPDHDPFLREDINDYILDYLATFAQAPDLAIQARWYGIYAKVQGQTEFIGLPMPGVRVVNGLSGAGMTLSFGLAEELVAQGVDLKMLSTS